ncbi:MAG: anti-sigma factor antagonist [Planctomycetota bacterium]|nr:MAG: anti-sigma factor antagonist [Planctomycetota bacterium]
MHIETNNHGDVLVVKLFESRLDSYVATDFRDAMDGFISQGSERIVLDLSKVEFVDSSGLGAIVTTQKRLGRARDLVICGPCETVMRLFKLARLDKIFQIVNTEDQALTVLEV